MKPVRKLKNFTVLGRSFILEFDSLLRKINSDVYCVAIYALSLDLAGNVIVFDLIVPGFYDTAWVL